MLLKFDNIFFSGNLVTENMSVCNVNGKYYDNSFRECIEKSFYKPGSIMIIKVPENERTYVYSDEYRVKFYLNEQFYDENLKYDYTKKSFQNELHTIGIKERRLEAYKNFFKCLHIDDSLGFNMKYLDYDYGLSKPTFVKCRPIDTPKKSIIFALENVYLGHHMLHLIKDDIQFEKKDSSKVIWRGVNSGYERGTRARRTTLVKNFIDSKSIDVGFTSFIYRHKNILPDEHKYLKPKISISEQLKYKFILSIEGNDFATNLLWIMLSNSVPICPKHFIETWVMESKLVPWVHYVPVKNDFSDLKEVYTICLRNDDLVKEIMYNSKLFGYQFLDIQRENSIKIKVINHFFNN